ncbi:sulfatase-like hydrolase/transferase [bacterium]|nr:sulfatase-like hydrolase/transferase [bacterium]
MLPRVRRLLLLVVLGTVGLSPVTAAERLPNVVFFLVDDLGWSDLGCYGSDFYETPRVDAFARDAVRFTQAYAACHVCSPTRASIMTGKYPARLQMTDWLPGRREFVFQRLKNAPILQQLPFEEVTLAEALKEHGYATGHFGKWHLGEEPSGPLNHGFDVQVPRWNKGWPRVGYHAPFRLDGLTDSPGDYLTDRLTDEALQFIDAHQDEPFFLYLSHFAVHDPIQGRADLVAKYQTKRDRLPRSVAPEFILEGNPDQPPRVWANLDELFWNYPYEGHRVLPDRIVQVKQRQNNPQFAAMVESMDQSFGRVLDRLRSLGIDEQTIVIFFSDNGGMSAANFGRPDRVIADDQLDTAYSTSNLPLRGAKGWLYEGGIRVPLLVRWPGHGPRGTTSDTPVISTDFYPTILEMLGVASRPEQHRDGVSFASLLQGGPAPDRDAIYWHFPHYSNHGMQSPGGAIRRGDYKLIEYFENQTVQLFNLSNDLAEQHDLAQQEPETAARLRDRLHGWRTQVSARMMERNPDYRPED